jgi:hypothetical protein
MQNQHCHNTSALFVNWMPLADHGWHNVLSWSASWSPYRHLNASGSLPVVLQETGHGHFHGQPDDPECQILRILGNIARSGQEPEILWCFGG